MHWLKVGFFRTWMLPTKCKMLVYHKLPKKFELFIFLKITSLLQYLTKVTNLFSLQIKPLLINILPHACNLKNIHDYFDLGCDAL
jgi:hypothetical protein